MEGLRTQSLAGSPEPSSTQAGERAILADIDSAITSQKPLALFLDIDGTLLDMANTPTAVHVPPELPDLLARLSERLTGALAIVTGRRIAEADHLLSPLKITAAGIHGAEVRLGPTAEVQSLATVLLPPLIADISSAVDALPGVVMEDKGGGLALHYRLAPEHRDELVAALDALRIKFPGQFSICQGRMVVELIPVGFSKGRALAQLSSLPNFANRLPIMIGDDIGDIDAFRIAKARGGYGLKVAGENFSGSESVFSGPADVLRWLDRLSRRL